MIVRIFKKKNRNNFVDPDEIFLDSQNLQNFDRQQFEGRIEKPIPRRTIVFLGAFFMFVFIIFFGRLQYLQIAKGESFLKRSENNTLDKTNLFADRGIIYDRNKEEIAWNEKLAQDPNIDNTFIPPDQSTLGVRTYKTPGFSHILGYVGYPTKDKSGNYWQSEFIGKDGLEKQYNDKLTGENGSKIVETDAQGNTHSENIVNTPKRGADLVTTLDSRIQSKLFSLIKDLSENYAFSGGAGVILDVTNGEVLTSASYPEYDGMVLSKGKDSKIISGYFNDKRKVFLDRTISGLYTPGSIVKPIFALAALNEGLISPDKQILSTGSISIANPYKPGEKTIFKDWKVSGWVDMAEAIAVSCDVYFYAIGGGYEDQKGMGIAKIEEYSKMFGIGQETEVDLPDETSGTIPNPTWKLKNFKGDQWRIGDTYHTSIGQYGFQVTPMEIVRAIGAIANKGTLVSPHFILGDTEKEIKNTTINIEKEKYTVIHDGMRQAVTYGTAVGLNVPYVDVAAKTGTAQLGLAKNRVNSWVVGFFPYEDPKYAFTIMMESGPVVNSVNATTVMRQLLDWMSVNTPEYFETNPQNIQ